MAGKHPSLPSNYVSLAVLKERWLEQQRKQSEEEELQRKHEEDQKKKIQNQNGGKSLQKSQSSSLHASRRNYQVTKMRDGQTSVASKPTLKESKSEASVSVCRVEQVEDKLNKEAKEKNDTRRKPRAEKTLSVPTSRSQPVEKLQVHTTERNEKIEEAGSEFPHNSVDQAAKHNFWKPRVRMSIAGKTNHQYSREFSSLPPPVEKLQANTTERKDKIEEAGCEFPHNNVDQAANHNTWKPRVRIGIAGKTNHQYSRGFSKEGFSSRSPPVENLQADTTERNYKIEEAGCEFPHNSVDRAANHNVGKPGVRMGIAGKTHHQFSRDSKGEFSSRSPPVEKLQADTTERNEKMEDAGCEFLQKIEEAASKLEQVEDEQNKKAKEKMDGLRKSRAEKNLSVPTSRSQPVKKLQAHTTENNEKIEEAECEFPHNSVDQAANHNVWEPKERMSTSVRTNYQYSRYSKRGDLHQKQTDCKQIWVKKGETTATQSSGIFVNAGGASSSNNGEDTDGTTSFW